MELAERMSRATGDLFLLAQGEVAAAIALVVILTFAAGVIGCYYWDTFRPWQDDPVLDKPRWYYKRGQWGKGIPPADSKRESEGSEP